MSSALIVFLATAGYGALHSALLTETARGAFEGWFGTRVYRGSFRLVYNLVATVLLGALVVFVAALPDIELFRVTGAGAVGLWAIRLAGLGLIWMSVRRVGTGPFLGVSHWWAWRRGRSLPGPGIETGDLVVGGPYRFVRHPMYAAGFLVLWADPHWSVNRVAFALAASLYLWLGALHEELRLARSFGDAYRRYIAVTPRFFPRIHGWG